MFPCICICLSEALKVSYKENFEANVPMIAFAQIVIYRTRFRYTRDGKDKRWKSSWLILTPEKHSSFTIDRFYLKSNVYETQKTSIMDESLLIKWTNWLNQIKIFFVARIPVWISFNGCHTKTDLPDSRQF